MRDERDGPASPPRERIVIVGGGFGGLACARELGNSAAEVTVIDRRNHNLFQPLLYQVATAALSPADISEPIRRTLGRYRNIRVRLAEVTGVDIVRRQVVCAAGAPVPYDRLVLAPGSEYNYFGHDTWRNLAPGLKTLHEARLIRQRLLLAFERAEAETDPEAKRRLLTSVIIGGGPTGVEMAGAISELGRFMVTRDFRTLTPDALRVVLVEGGPRILPSFPEDLAAYANGTLANAGVEIMTGTMVTELAEGLATTNRGAIDAGCIVWGAGVKAVPVAAWLGVKAGPAGRVPVGSSLEVEGCPGVFALGDAALALGEQGQPLPALAQVAKQQGIYLGRALRAGRAGDPAHPFRFHDRGNTAVVGRNAAIFDFGRWHLKGRLAWLLWGIVHVYLLVSFEKRVLVAIQWVWRYATRQRGARIIEEVALPEPVPDDKMAEALPAGQPKTRPQA